jgi:hypothetical protein
VEYERAAQALGGHGLLRAFIARRDRELMPYSQIASELEEATGVRVTGQTITNWLRRWASEEESAGNGNHSDATRGGFAGGSEQFAR